MEEIHLVCKKKHVNNGIIYQPQLVFSPDFFLSSINSTSLPFSLLKKKTGKRFNWVAGAAIMTWTYVCPPLRISHFDWRLGGVAAVRLCDLEDGLQGLVSVVIWSPLYLFQPFGKGTTGEKQPLKRDDPPRKSVPMGLPVAVGWKISATPKSPQSLS